MLLKSQQSLDKMSGKIGASLIDFLAEDEASTEYAPKEKIARATENFMITPFSF